MSTRTRTRTTIPQNVREELEDGGWKSMLLYYGRVVKMEVHIAPAEGRMWFTVRKIRMATGKRFGKYDRAAAYFDQVEGEE